MRRSKDGRFVPRSGEDLPPRRQQPRDEHGHFIPGDKVSSSKPYSKAVRELLDASEGDLPESWNRAKLTEAQGLAMVHVSMAKAGNVQVGMMVVDRAEGKVPQAAEDRDAAIKAGTGIRVLASLLGMDLKDVIDAEVVSGPDQGAGEKALGTDLDGQEQHPAELPGLGAGELGQSDHGSQDDEAIPEGS